jgi:hypothetical protein
LGTPIGERDERRDHDELHRCKRGLELQEIRDGSHVVLGGDGRVASYLLACADEEAFPRSSFRLSDRLSRLEAAGVMDKREHDADARRYAYRLTKKGIDLAPLMVEIVLWSARHEETEAPPQIVRAMATRRAKFLSDIRKAWQASQLTSPMGHKTPGFSSKDM